MTRIVTTRYRYKRPPRRKKPVALEVPAVITAKQPLPGAPAPRAKAAALATVAASDDHRPAIISIRRKPERILPPGLLPKTPAEHQRRGDAADSLFRELVRRVTGKDRT